MLELWHRRFIDDTTGRVDGALTPQVSTMAPVGSRRAG
jgi:hypothetical protein